MEDNKIGFSESYGGEKMSKIVRTGLTVALAGGLLLGGCDKYENWKGRQKGKSNMTAGRLIFSEPVDMYPEETLSTF